MTLAIAAVVLALGLGAPASNPHDMYRCTKNGVEIIVPAPSVPGHIKGGWVCVKIDDAAPIGPEPGEPPLIGFPGFDGDDIGPLPENPVEPFIPSPIDPGPPGHVG